LRRFGRASGQALSICALGAVSALLAGCTAAPAGSSVSVSGKTLTVYIAAPPASQIDARAQDVLDAEELAFKLQRGTVSGFTVADKVLNGAKPSDNARTAIQDQTTIAYLGEILPGTSADSLGILNDQDVLTLGPTDTAVELTQSTPAVPGAPDKYYEARGTYGSTFARVVPTTALEAKAIVSELAAEKIAKAYLTDDGQHYGAALARAVRQAAGSTVSIASGAPTARAVATSGAQAVVYATGSAPAAKTLFDAVAAANPSTKLFAPSALDDSAFAASLSPAASAALRVSSPGFTPGALTATGRGFETAFQSTYGHAPSPQAIFGYEAMSALLSVLHEAGTSANNRTTVVKDFLAIHNRNSVLGTYSINANGDTSLAPFVISRVKSGQLVPFRFVSEQG
jgi:branched-chain amino acid transport system substrate-binding protein